MVVTLLHKVKKDVGGVTAIPSIIIVYFDEQKTLRVKFEGVEEILEGLKRLVLDVSN